MNANATLRERLRAERRREIIDAAWAVARDQGVGGLTLRAVAARVGLQPPSLYEYFPSKESLYDALFAEGYDAFLGTMPGAVDPTPGRDRAAAWLRRFLAFCRSDVARYQLLFQPSIPGFHPSAESMRRAEAAVRVFDQELTAIGIRRPQARDLWTALVTGMANQQIANDPNGDRWELLTDEAVEMFMNHAELKELPYDDGG